MKKFVLNALKDEKIKMYLNILKEYDEDTYEHSIRVANYAEEIGIRLNIDEFYLEELVRGALLHDIGKTKIDKSIILKNGKLTDEERYEITMHPIYGFEILKDWQNKIIKRIVIGHHEYQIKSYPRNEINNRRLIERINEKNNRRNNDPNIEKLVQIVTVADYVDALSSKRSYKNEMSFEKIIEILKKDFTGDNDILNVIIK